MPEGVDVSQFQGDIDPDWFDQWDFVIVRAFDRHGDLDKRFVRNWQNAYGRTLRGVYGWPKPGADNRALGQALAAAAPDAEFGYWADYEHSAEYGLASHDDLEDYLAGIGDRPKGVYSPVGSYPGGVADSLPWWVANYGPTDGRPRNYGERLELPPLPRPYQVHQFTSQGNGPGAPGLDRNYAPTLDLWGAQMPNPIYPGATWMPGRNAGYAAGRTPVRSVVCHQTIGVNSTGIGLQGYYQFQVNRDGTVYQFAETDAVCWHAGSPWNGYGPGVEVEYHPAYDDEPWTPAQRDAVAHLCQWLHDEWGVPYDFYDGPRTNSHTGFITHRSLIQTGDSHSDWWPELPRVTAPAPEENDDMVIVFGKTIGPAVAAVCDGGKRIGPLFDGPEGAYGIPQSAYDWNNQPGRNLRYVHLDPVRLAEAIQ